MCWSSRQHEASKLETASDVASINDRQEDLLSEFDLISFLCSESSPRDDLKTLEDCINFLMEPVLNLEPSVQGDQSAIVSSFEGEPPTIGGEMHNTLTTQPNFVTVSSNAFQYLEASNCVSAPQVACGTAHRDVSTCGAQQEAVSNCGAEQEIVSTCGAKQEDVITVLQADPYKTVAFPDKTELEDAAIRMKLTYDFCNPEGISVFASCVEAALEENLELFETCKKVLFTRLVDPQTSMARERELGYPDLTEVINKMDELTEAVGGYWPVSDKCAWMLGFLHPNELLFLKSLMEPEWKTMMDTATTTEDILVSAYWGLCEFLTRFEGSEETKHASLSSNHNQGDTNGCDLGSDKFNASFENGAGLQETTSSQMKRKREVDEDELYLPPRKRITMGDGDFIF